MSRSRTAGIEKVIAAPADVATLVDAAERGLSTALDLTAARDPRTSAAEPVLPVVVCLWRRHHRLPALMRMLARQRGVVPELYLWNNDADQAAATVEMVAAAQERPEVVWLVNSPSNVGGFGRFFWARQLAERFPAVVFVDDDEVLDDDVLATFLEESGTGRIRSAWAFRFNQRFDYWRRLPARYGEAAKYCGTGGMVSDSTIFTDPRLFRCPVKYWFCEDIWLSYFAATVLKWDLRKSEADVALLLDESAQFPVLHKDKARLFRLLNRRGGWIDPPA